MRSPAASRAGALAGMPTGGSWFAGIAPGRYTMFARTFDSSGWSFASADVTVDGEDLANVALSMVPALTLAGRLAFESATGRVPLGGAAAIPDAGITLAFPRFPPASGPGTVQPEIRIESGGRFSVVNLAPGTYRAFRGAGLQGVRTPIGLWWLKSIVIDGRDLPDRPFDIRESTTKQSRPSPMRRARSKAASPVPRACRRAIHSS